LLKTVTMTIGKGKVALYLERLMRSSYVTPEKVKFGEVTLARRFD